jgi:hypothetical protein
MSTATSPIKKGSWPLLKNNKIAVGFFVFILLAFSYGLLHLFLLRFESGDVYAPYSSLRSDPLGTRALYESLAYLEISPVSRNYRPDAQLQFNARTTYLYLGAQVFRPERVSEEFADAVDRLTSNGGRLVVAFLPVKKAPGVCRPCDPEQSDQKESTGETDQNNETTPDQTGSGKSAVNETDEEKPEAGEDFSEQSDDVSPCLNLVSLKERWGVSFDYIDDDTENEHQLAVADAAFKAEKLPHAISWHSVLYFSNLDASWKIIYRFNGKPVIVERPYKSGTILLSADSYLFSNEALWSERHPVLLSRLVGPHSNIVFDEAHLGVYEIPGIAGLIRRFGFHWFFLGIIVVFALFIWKNSSHFVPPLDIQSGGSESNATSGRDYAQGLISLLQRNIPVKAVLRVSLEEWKKSFGTRRPESPNDRSEKSTMSSIEDIVSENQSDPVKGYNAICRLVSEGKSP